MSSAEQTKLPLDERIERALVLLAYFIELDGDVHLPMYEKFEAELAQLKRTEDVRARARSLLDGYRHSAERRLMIAEAVGLNSDKLTDGTAALRSTSNPRPP